MFFYSISIFFANSELPLSVISHGKRSGRVVSTFTVNGFPILLKISTFNDTD